MSPIVDMQARFRELGRIRLGQQVAWEKDGRTGTRPAKLETWRMTSPSKDTLERAAAIYGGTVRPWTGDQATEPWELITEAKSLDIIIPPLGEMLSQWYEMWSGGGCVRRCDGRREMLTDSPCLCPADPGDRNELAAKGEACKPTSRLAVVLPNLPDVGIWLLVTHGYYGAVELLGTTNLLAAARAAGQLVRASIRIDQREVKRPGIQTRHFPVPVIEVAQSMAELLPGVEGAPSLLAAGPTKPPTPTGDVPLPADPRFAPTDDGTFRYPAEAAPPPLSYSEFKDLIAASGMDKDKVRAAHAERFPTGPATKDITDEQRGRLWADLTRTPVQETPAASTRPAEPSAAPPVGDVPVVSGEVIDPTTDPDYDPDYDIEVVSATDDEGISLAQLTDALHKAGKAFAYAEARAQDMFGVNRLDALSNAQRLDLAAALSVPV